MLMSDGEIYRSFMGAKNRKEQVKILADLNACNTKKIQEIITAQQEKLNKETALYDSYISTDSYKAITQRLDELDALISKYTKEYQKLANILKRKNAG